MKTISAISGCEFIVKALQCINKYVESQEVYYI
jgi:hypothetical protein